MDGLELVRPPLLNLWVLELEMASFTSSGNFICLADFLHYESTEAQERVQRAFGHEKAVLLSSVQNTDERRNIVEKMVYEAVNQVLWDKDGAAVAKQTLDAISPRIDILPADFKAAFATVASCLHPLSSETVDTWQTLKAETKSTHRLVRQFVNLPLGVHIMKAIDSHILQAKKNQVVGDKLDKLKKEMVASSMNKVKKFDEFVIAMGKFRKEFIGALAGVSDETRDELASRVQPCTKLLDDACKTIGSHYAGLLHTALHSLISKVLAACIAAPANIPGFVKELPHANSEAPDFWFCCGIRASVPFGLQTFCVPLGFAFKPKGGHIL